VIYSSPGTFSATFTVTDNAGLTDPNPPTRTITVQPDFSLSASPASQTVSQGSGTSFTATATAGTGFTGNVSFSVSGLPAGATPSFSPASISASGSSTLSVSTSLTTAPGSYPLTVTATSGTLTHTANVTLVVSINFSVAIAPSNVTVARGSQALYKVTITPDTGFIGTVSFRVNGLPLRATASFSPISINTSGSSNLTIKTNHKSPTGVFTLTITATGGGLAHSKQATLTIK